MAPGPTHPSIQREVRRTVRSARVRMGLSVLILGGVFWGLHHPDQVVVWAQEIVREILPGLLQVVD